MTSHDLVMNQGASFVQNVIVKDSADAVVDITGCSVVMVMRTGLRSATKLLDIGTVEGSITISGALGTISVDVPGSVTADINQSGIYELTITYASGEIERLLEGKIALSPAVIR